MQKITPYLWFDDKAEEAINFYTSVFENGKIGTVTRLEGAPGPAGSVLTATFQLAGQEFMALNGGPAFSFTPAISFFVNCETAAQVDKLWAKLSAGGSVLMELAQYPFNDKFGWVADRFGVSWQWLWRVTRKASTPLCCLSANTRPSARSDPVLCLAVQKFERRPDREYGPGEGEPAGASSTPRSRFTAKRSRRWTSSLDHAFTFTEAISFFVNCKTQAEVDQLWAKLSAGGEIQQCGWLKTNSESPGRSFPRRWARCWGTRTRRERNG